MDKSKEDAKMQSLQEKHPPEASQGQPQAPNFQLSTQASCPPIMNLVTKGPGMKVSHLKSWSEKATKLMDKLMELANISYIMEQNNAPVDENILFLKS